MFNWIKNLFGFGTKPTSIVVTPAVTVSSKPTVKSVADVATVNIEPKVETSPAEVAKVKSTKRRPYYPEKPKATPSAKAKPKASPKKPK